MCSSSFNCDPTRPNFRRINQLPCIDTLDAILAEVLLVVVPEGFVLLDHGYFSSTMGTTFSKKSLCLVDIHCLVPESPVLSRGVLVGRPWTSRDRHTRLSTRLLPCQGVIKRTHHRSRGLDVGLLGFLIRLVQDLLKLIRSSGPLRTHIPLDLVGNRIVKINLHVSIDLKNFNLCVILIVSCHDELDHLEF